MELCYRLGTNEGTVESYVEHKTPEKVKIEQRFLKSPWAASLQEPK
jgi:hypothetical protein